MGLIRVFLFAALGLTVVYWLLAIYSRSTERERLEKKWDAGPPEGAPDRDAFIEAGMAKYERSLRRKLIWLVYIVPLTVVAIIIYFVNVQ
ncbi:MAG: hypothetical protein K0B00_00515 [Rhodobacteraceae bacterium]|nr:hypothetical protein [Paracoccaceae bacterium]